MKARINVIIDIILMGLLVAITITGIQSSPSSLSGNVDDDQELAHGLIAAALFILSIVHACMHIRIKKRKPQERTKPDNQTTPVTPSE